MMTLVSQRVKPSQTRLMLSFRLKVPSFRKLILLSRTLDHLLAVWGSEIYWHCNYGEGRSCRLSNKSVAYVDGTFTTERQFNELLQSQSEIGTTKTWSNNLYITRWSSRTSFWWDTDAEDPSGMTWTGSASGGTVQWDTSWFPINVNLAVYLYEEPGGGGPASVNPYNAVAMYRPTKLLTLTQVPSVLTVVMVPISHVQMSTDSTNYVCLHWVRW